MNTGGYEGMSENGRLNQMQELERQWVKRQRWNGIIRTYRAEDVIQLRGSVQINYTLAKLATKRLWHLPQSECCCAAWGAWTGNRPAQLAKDGLKLIDASAPNGVPQDSVCK